MGVEKIRKIISYAEVEKVRFEVKHGLSREDEVTIVRDLDRVQQSNAVDCSLVRQKPSGQKWAKFSQYWNVGALFHYFSESEVMVSFFRAEIVTS